MIMLDAEQCARIRDDVAKRTHWETTMLKANRNKKAGLRQVRCIHCRRYCWPEDRCNLFEARAASAQETGR